MSRNDMILKSKYLNKLILSASKDVSDEYYRWLDDQNLYTKTYDELTNGELDIIIKKQIEVLKK